MTQSNNEPEPRRFRANVPNDQVIDVNRVHERLPTQPFRPLPTPTGGAPYHLLLEAVLPAERIKQITDAKKMVFQTIGDTGGIKRPEEQQLVANNMEIALQASDVSARPAFFYHLGDVVYYYGEETQYYSQFYEPYSHYNAPIFAIPGNHDGDLQDMSIPSLQAFNNNFCSAEAQIAPSSGDAPRDTMTQPNVYWTLETPLATFIGLYTNVPDGGELGDDQIAWLHSELEGAPRNKALIVAMHHPIYSADSHHSGSKYMEDLFDAAMVSSKRLPDLVLTAHVHNYQRYTRQYNGASITYMVVGSGGYWNLHQMVQPLRQPASPISFPFPIPNRPDLVLNSFLDSRHGFLTLTVTPDTIRGEYYTVPRPQESWSAPAVLFDQFTIDLHLA